MEHFESTLFQIEAIRADIVHEARQRQSQSTKPMGSLGRLESIAVQLAAIQRTQMPEARDAHCVIFAADHPVVMHGVSAFPAAVPPAMVHNIINGGAAPSVLAAKLDVPIEIVDVGVNNLDGVTSSSRCTYHRVTAAADGAVGDLTTASAMP